MNQNYLEILNAPMEKNAAGVKTLWEYLNAVQDSFYTTHRTMADPFDKGKFWIEDDIIYHLVLNKFIAGEIDDKGVVKDYNGSEFRAIMRGIFTHLRTADITTLQQPPEPKEYACIKIMTSAGPDPTEWIADSTGNLFTKEQAEKWLDNAHPGHNGKYWRIVKVK